MTSRREPAASPPVAELVEITTGGFRLGVLPGLGGSITHLVWTPSDGPAPGADIDLMRRATEAGIASGNPSNLASFAMVPFTNRIDAGKISFTDGSGHRHAVQVPINRPAQNAAIHGFGRLARWQVAEWTACKVRLTQLFADAGNPYAYAAEQVFALTRTHVECTLGVTNQGATVMPFGIGFHPWFDRTPAATLAFSATHAFRMDARDMPVEAIPAGEFSGCDAHAHAHRFAISARTPFDTPVGGWAGTATITWPEWHAALDISASGAFRLIHIFSPKEPAVFCVEPVSHLPDVINRRHLSGHGDMTLLAPGESMTGMMRLTPRVVV